MPTASTTPAPSRPIPDGKVSGCDILAARTEFTITVTRAEVTLDYIRQLISMVATLNKFEWAGFGIAEVLYLGCNAQGTQRGQWTMNHRFAAGSTQDAEICDGFTVPTVLPWDVLDVTYEADSDTTVGGMPRPLDAYVHRVYRRTDFSLLQIGV